MYRDQLKTIGEIQMATLAEIRAKLQAQTNQRSTPQGDGAIYPHWNINDNESARLRLLPDGNKDNTYFWVERALINLEFPGIKGQPDSKRVTVQVPCVEMWGESCPILAEVRPWYKDESLKETANKYWKKRSYIYQGFVRENPIADDKTPENPLRRFIISPQIFTLVKASLLDPELENLPTDYTGGLDFIVTKTTKGDFADYTTSKWSRKETALTEDEMAAVEKFGLADLSTFLPKKPTAAELEIMVEMFHASVDGEPYDQEKWGAHVRPRGQANPAGNTGATTPATTATASPVSAPKPTTSTATAQAEAEASVPFEADTPTVTETVVTPTGTGTRADEILAMIRNRQKTV